MARWDELSRGSLGSGRALVVASVIVPLLLFAIVGWFDRRAVLLELEREAQANADVFQHHALNVFETHELIAREIDEHVRGMRWDEIAASEAVHAYLQQLQSRYPQVQGLWLADRSGAVRSASRVFPLPPVSVADRDYFQALRAADVGTFIGQPVLGHLWSAQNFNLVRRRARGVTGFDGVIIVTVFPSYFVEYWRQTRAPLDAVTTLIRGDRKILARDPSTDLEDLAPHANGARALADAEPGTYRAISAADGVERIVAYRRIGPYDVFVAHGVGVQAGLGRWRAHLAVYGAWFGAASICLLIVSIVAMRRGQRERAAIEQRLAIERQLHQAQKMEAIGQFSGGIAHDLNNLLTPLLGNLDLLKGVQRTPESEDRVRRAIDAAERAGKAVQSLLAFVHRRPQKPELLDCWAVCGEMDDLFRQVLGGRAQLKRDVADGLWPVALDKTQLELALLNIVVNARDAMPEGGTLRIGGVNTHLNGTPDDLHGDFVKLSVTDTGAGMDAAVLARIFEPFYTTKDADKGTGLGLSQVRGLVVQAGGAVTAVSAVGRGTTITLYLPRSPADARRDAAGASSRVAA